MSSVRMCDYEGCGTIFSEREIGWTTGTMNFIAEDGVKQERADFCPEHSPNRPRRPGLLPRLKATIALPPSTSSDAPTREEAIAKIMKSGRTREEASDIVTELGFK